MRHCHGKRSLLVQGINRQLSSLPDDAYTRRNLKERKETTTRDRARGLGGESRRLTYLRRQGDEVPAASRRCGKTFQRPGGNKCLCELGLCPPMTLPLKTKSNCETGGLGPVQEEQVK